MLTPKLFLAQRLTALLLAPLVAAHLVGIITAIHGGLDAAEILSRTRGSIGFALFYQTFVIAVAIHAAIGLRVICYEWGGLKGGALDALTWAVALVLLASGSFAVATLALG